jgi:YesN/AraC family two-component response regulator
MNWNSNLPKLPKNNPSLLIIDDSADVVEMLSDLFEDDYICMRAMDGQDGINKTIELIPDIVLCDVNMPRKSGLEVVVELKNDSRTRLIPIILLSGYNTRENRLEGLQAMADDFVAKPFDFEELRIKMSNLLKIRHEIKMHEPEDIIFKELGLDTERYSHNERHLMEFMVSYFANNYSNRKLDVQNISDQMDLSIRQLQRKIKSITGHTPMDLLRFYRLKQSAQLLIRHSSIAEVSEACGFRSPNYYCTCFKDYFQMTPSQYQKRNK